MPKQAPLFNDDATPSPLTTPSHSKLTVSALQFGAGQLSPAQKRFNQLLKQTEALAQKIEGTRQLADAHRLAAHQTLAPLQRQRDALMREMVLWLDGRLQRKGLSAKQRDMAIEVLSHMSSDLANAGDAAMSELFDKYNELPEFDDADEAEDTAEMQAFMEAMWGEPLRDDGTAFESIDDLMQAGFAKIQEQMSAQAQSREHAQAQHKKPRKKSAAQLKAEAAATAQTLDATSALRTIYRQLVSALHPDREPDPQEQLRKTALMKEANTAYEKRDLLALLQLQLRAELTDTAQMAHMAKEKMAALTTLLKDRVNVLTNELFALERQMLIELDLPMFSTLSPTALRRHLRDTAQDLNDTIAQLQHELLAVQNDAFFKRWLRQQQSAIESDFDLPF